MRKINDYAIPDYNPYDEFTDLQFFVFLDKYANYLPEEGRRETWDETVARSVDVLRYLSQDKLDKSTYQFIFDSIYRMDVLPSMRLLSMPMAAVERDNSVIYNCSSIGIDSIKSIADCLYLSMSGCGVGVSVEKQYISKLPKVSSTQNFDMVYHHVIPDTQIGWAESVRILLQNLIVDGINTRFDYSAIRPAGAYLATKGGYASGPQPLIDLHDHIRKIVSRRKGQYLTSIDVLDIVTKIGDCAVSGGSRRSAISVIFDYDDNLMLTAKSGNYYEHSPWRANSNNSAVWYDDMPMQHKRDLVEELFANGNGEPGIWNKSAQFRTLPDRRKPNIYDASELNSNPSLRAGTKVVTDLGVLPIERLQDQNFNVLNLNSALSPAKCFKSGENKQLYRILFEGNVEYYCTPEHQWPVIDGDMVNKTYTHQLKTNDRIPVSFNKKITFGKLGDYNDGFLSGWIYGDGWITLRKDSNKKQIGMIIAGADDENGCLDRLKNKLDEIGVKFKYQKRNGTDNIELNTTSSKFIKWSEKFGLKSKQDGLPDSIWNDVSEEYIWGFIDGIISSDGSVSNTQIKINSSFINLINDLLDLLGLMGIKAGYNKRITKNVFNDINEYENYTIYFSHQLYPDDKFITHVDKNSNINREKRSVVPNYRKIISVELTDIYEDVWDITVYDDSHCFTLPNIITGNCFEIVLKTHEFCNLSTAVLRPTDSDTTMTNKVIAASIIGTIQSMADNFPYIDERFQKNLHDERLLGVCLTGIADVYDKLDARRLERLKSVALTFNMTTAKRLGINPSLGVTAVKPSGNTSALTKSGPGINPEHTKYSYRNVVVNRNTAMFNFLYANGVEHIDHPTRSTDAVFKFPKENKDSLTLDDTNAIKQLEIWKQYKSHYTEHNPSVSITYRKDEIEDIKDWIYEHDKIIGGTAFFPSYDSNHPYLPIQEITKGEYDNALRNFPKLTWSNFPLYETGFDERNAVAECAGGNGSCAIMT